MELQGYIETDDNNGTKWVCCPWCGKRNILITKATKVKYLPYKCKGCRDIFPIIDVGYSIKKPKQLQGQLDLKDYL